MSNYGSSKLSAKRKITTPKSQGMVSIYDGQKKKIRKSTKSMPMFPKK